MCRFWAKKRRMHAKSDEPRAVPPFAWTMNGSAQRHRDGRRRREAAGYAPCEAKKQAEQRTGVRTVPVIPPFAFEGQKDRPPASNPAGSRVRRRGHRPAILHKKSALPPVGRGVGTRDAECPSCQACRKPMSRRETRMGRRNLPAFQAPVGTDRNGGRRYSPIPGSEPMVGG